MMRMRKHTSKKKTNVNKFAVIGGFVHIFYKNFEKLYFLFSGKNEDLY